VLNRTTSRYLAGLFLLPVVLSIAAELDVNDVRELSVDVSRVDGRIAMNLDGNIWTMPESGGLARRHTDGITPATRPRWSPDGRRILYQLNTHDGAQIWQLDAGQNAGQNSAQRISATGQHNQDGAWHPQGERIVYASDRHDTGLDLWETDLPTGLSWRLTQHVGDELEPAWSSSGRHLAYIRRTDDHYILVLRRFAQAETNLVVSDTPLSAPSWRPDGSLLTFLRDDPDGQSLQMVILSEPALVLDVPGDEHSPSSAIRWRNRMQMVFAANGAINIRGFEDRKPQRLYFSAAINTDPVRPPLKMAPRELEVIDAPQTRLVIRGARLFDGIGQYYRERFDVVVSSGRIVAVEPRRDWNDATILDLGDVTIVPGLIDVWSALPDSPAPKNGAALLAYGITTLVTDHALTEFDSKQWESESYPGPRVLPAISVAADTPFSARAENPSNYYSDNFLVRLKMDDVPIDTALRQAQTWRDAGIPVIADNHLAGKRIGADIILGVGSAFAARLSGQAEFSPSVPERNSPMLISGLADSGTSGIDSLLASRHARALGHSLRPQRRHSSGADLNESSALIIAGSKANGLPPGLALHAELRSLAASGLTGEQILRAAGNNAARVLGIEHQVGTIVPGAMADLVLVRGDPLTNIEDMLDIVAVVRNGRFFSLVSLLERASSDATVE